jgi:dTDP-4-dehydrorhamnose reductase
LRRPLEERWPGACVFTDHPRVLGDEVRFSTIGCDLDEPYAVEQLASSLDLAAVIHLAGNKDVFALENAPALARKANVQATENLVSALRDRSTLLVFISSDYVFAGTDGPYDEASPTRPGTEYGRSKLAAERVVQASGLPAAIVRSSSLFGFRDDFVEEVRETLRRGDVFRAFSDLISNPTAIADLAEMLRRIVDGRVTGTFHAAGPQALSREAFAHRIARAFDLNAGLIEGCLRNESIRPGDLSLDCSSTYARLGYQPRPLEDILRNS